jgi:hypothetical protein
MDYNVKVTLETVMWKAAHKASKLLPLDATDLAIRRILTAKALVQ